MHNIECSNFEKLIEKSISFFKSNCLDCYVYVNNNDALEEFLKVASFSLKDIMHVMIARGQPENNAENKSVDSKYNIIIEKIGFEKISIWTDVFCNAFDVPLWRAEVERILGIHYNEFVLLLAYVNNIPAGCAVLINKTNMTGIYCLGVVSHFRRIGVGSAIIKKAQSIAFSIQKSNSNSGDSLVVLQTFASEGAINFYQRVGFEKIYSKKIYVFSNRL